MEVYLDFEQPIDEIDKKIKNLKESDDAGSLKQIEVFEKVKNELEQKIYKTLTPWQRVKIARHPQRPYFIDYVKLIFENFMELHGDRVFGDDHAILCGIATIDEDSIVVIGHQKGRTVDENMDRNFGMAHPEGYRKAMRLMNLAGKFNKPIVTFVDTSGAYPGIAAEERGQAEAIARNLRDMFNLKVPIITIVIGEGGSGGALGIGVSNKVLMLENAYYSVISPEGCAAILFRDGSKASEAAQAMKITAKDLLDFKIIDEIIKEPFRGAHYDHAKMAENIKMILKKYLNQYRSKSYKEVINERYLKFRNMGIYKDDIKNNVKAMLKKTANKEQKAK